MALTTQCYKPSFTCLIPPKLQKGFTVTKLYSCNFSGWYNKAEEQFGDIYFILYFITKPRLFILQLTSQGKGIFDVNRKWEDRWDSPTSYHFTSQAPPLRENFEIAASQQSSCFGCVGLFFFLTREKNFFSVSFLSLTFWRHEASSTQTVFHLSYNRHLHLRYSPSCPEGQGSPTNQVSYTQVPCSCLRYAWTFKIFRQLNCNHKTKA